MSQFGNANLKVYADQGKWPSISRDSDKVPHYVARIRIDTEGDLVILQGYVTIATPKMARGGFLGMLVIDGGGEDAGEHNLTIPYSKGEPQTFPAVLIDLGQVQADSRTTGFFYATADWIITSSEITP